MKIIKKIILMSLLAILVLPATVSAVALQGLGEKVGEARSATTTVSSGESFEVLKTNLINLIDRSIAKIGKSIERINNNTNLSVETKDLLLEDLNRVKSNLLIYKDKVNATTSIAELKTLNQEVRKYLKDNKDVIKANAKKTIIALSQEALRMANELLEMAEEVLVMVDEVCGADDKTVQQLTKDINELEASINNLSAAIDSGDTQIMKSEMLKIAILSVKIYNEIYSLQGTCY